ncbi:hypothetical protein SUGI_0960490 [Cryptomeria japonica]|nr:hypothetical protein SUGI_0960490 [Cryptomeria japonica]
MRMFSASCSHHTIYVITASAFFALCIFSTSLSDAGFSRMKISHSVGASNLTNNNPNSSYKNRRLLDVSRNLREYR